MTIKVKNNKSNSMSSGLIWRFAERWLCQIISFIITIIIARILDPEAYGIVAIISAFISIFSVFVDSGLGNSLVQKKNPDELDFSTVFYTNTLFCIIVYLILFFVSPAIEKYYSMDGLASLIRVSGITLLISALKNVQEAYVSKHLLFKKFFFSSLVGTLGSGVLGIWMALNGYGVWALVMSNVFDCAVDTLFMFFSIDWKPSLLFSFERLKGLYNYGWKIFFSTILNRVYKKMYQLIIGKYYSSADLAYYDKGSSTTDKITGNVDATINSVLFPFLSIKQDNKKDVKEIARQTLKTNFYIMTPLLVGLFVVTEPMISVILTDKWLPATFYIRIHCIISILLPFHTMNLNVIKSIGRSDIFLKLEIYKKISGILILLLTVKNGPYMIACGALVSNVVSLFINSYTNTVNINYGIFEQVKDIIPTAIAAIIMGIIVNLYNYLSISSLYKLMLQIISGGLIYISLSYVLKIDVFVNIINAIRKKINERRKS